MKKNPVIHRYLDHGMEVYLHPVDFAPIANLQVVVKAGSIDETDDVAGVAHVLEHMLFKGSELYPASGDIAGRVESAGGDMNAYTTFDHTTYYLTAPAAFAFEGASLLLDMVSRSLLDPGELSRELEVIVEEIRRGRDNPSSVMFHQLYGELFQGTRLGRPIIGFEEVVSKFTRAQVLGFYQRWYCPNNMLFIAAGDFDSEKLFAHLQQAGRHFNPASLPARERPMQELTPQEGGVRAVLKRGPYQEARVQLALRGPGLEDESAAAWEMFATVLGHGDSSRLAQAVRDDAQLVTAIDASFSPYRYPSGVMNIGFFGRAESANEAFRSILLELDRLAHEAPSHPELTRVLNMVRAEHVYARESVEGIARNAGMALQTSLKLGFDDIYLKRLGEVTPAIIQETARKAAAALRDGKGVISVAVAQDAPGAETLTEEGLRSLVREIFPKKAVGAEAGDARSADPRPGDRNARTSFAKPSHRVSARNDAVQQFRFPLPDGLPELRVNYRVSRRLPIASGALVWQGGNRMEAREKAGTGWLASQMLTRGTRKQSYKAFVEELEMKAASVHAACGVDTFSLRFDALAEHAGRTFEMMRDCLLRPSFQSDEWERAQRESLETLTAQKDSPGARLSRVSGPLLYEGHPYGKPSLGTLETVGKLELQDAMRFWSGQLQTGTLVLTLAGDVDPERFAHLLAQDLVDFLAEARAAAPGFELKEFDRARLDALRPTRGRVGYDPFEREQAHISVAFRAVPLSDPRRTSLEVASNILGGQGGRLFLDLRDKQSLAYSVGASQSPSLLGGLFSTYIGTAAPKAKEAITGLKQHLMRLALEPVLPAELDRAKQSLIGGQAIDSQHHSTQATQLAMSDVYGLDFDNFLAFEDRVRAVTAESIREVFTDLLRDNPPVISIVGPQGTFVPEEGSEWTRW